MVRVFLQEILTYQEITNCQVRNPSTCGLELIHPSSLPYLIRTRPSLALYFAPQKVFFSATGPLIDLVGPDCVGNFTQDEVVRHFKEQFPDVYDIMGPEKIISDHKANPFSSLYYVDTGIYCLEQMIYM